MPLCFCSEMRNYDDHGEYLAHYLLLYGGGNYSETEAKAAQAIWTRRRAVYKCKNSPERKAAILKDAEKLESLPGVRELLSEGKLDFSNLVVQRFERELPDVIAWCPRCGKALRTPTARQCMWCFHDWHAT